MIQIFLKVKKYFHPQRKKFQKKFPRTDEKFLEKISPRDRKKILLKKIKKKFLQKKKKNIF